MPRTIVVLSLIVCLVLGCSSGGPPTHGVSGVITYEGQPVAGAQVGFIPADGSADVQPARGQTDAEGRYTLRTYVNPEQDVTGAMAGNFKVTVTKGIAQDRIVGYEDLAKSRDSLPAKYTDVKTTPLAADVTEGGDNTFDFTLDAE